MISLVGGLHGAGVSQGQRRDLAVILARLVSNTASWQARMERMGQDRLFCRSFAVSRNNLVSDARFRTEAFGDLVGVLIRCDHVKWILG
jgi:hypothetical protein